MASIELRQRQVLGTPNPVFVGFNVCCIIAAFVLAWGWLTAAPNDSDNVLSVTPPLGVIVFAAVMSSSMRIVGHRSGMLLVVGYFVTWQVPVPQVAKVVINDGLKVVTLAGRSIGTSAYGYSSTGWALRYPRASQAQERIQKFLESILAESNSTTAAIDLRPQIRWKAIVIALLIDGVLIAGALLINTARVG